MDVRVDRLAEFRMAERRLFHQVLLDVADIATVFRTVSGMDLLTRLVVIVQPHPKPGAHIRQRPGAGAALVGNHRSPRAASWSGKDDLN
jgi:hypothetical protein